LAKQIADATARLKNIETSHGALATEMKAQLDALRAEIKSVSGTIKSSASASAPYESRIKKTEAAIESIDATRMQLNNRIVTIERRLNDMQLLLRQLQEYGESPAG
jgi:septal ring factor EnvC (AmiA/AmiB activator)